MNEDEAAVKMQKCVRKYLKRKQRSPKSPSSVRIDNDRNNSEDDTPRAKKVLDDVNLLYKRLRSIMKKKEEIKRLCRSIDRLSENLKAIKKLEDCEEVEASFCDNATMEGIKQRHLEQIRQSNLRWWEKLDIYEAEAHK